MTTDDTEPETPIVIRPAITCPPDFPQQCADLHDELLTIAPKVIELAERIGPMMLPVVHAAGYDEDVVERFDEATGWGRLRQLLDTLGDYLLAAGGGKPDYISPSWLKAVQVEQWKLMVADPRVPESTRKDAERWLQMHDERKDSDLGYVEQQRAMEDRLREGLPIEADQ